MNEKKALGFGVSAVLLWSTVATAFKITLDYFTVIQMLSVACFVSIIALFIIATYQKTIHQIFSVFINNPFYYLLLGFINPLFYYLVLFKSYELLPASQAQPLNYSWAITLTLMAGLFLKQRIRKQDWIACLLGYLGVIIIATKGNVLALQFDNLFGVSLALFSTLLWAGYWILNAKNRADPVLGLLIGFLVALPFTIALAFYENASWTHINIKGWLAVFYVGLFEMGITFFLWLSALRLTENTARISTLIFASPFISLLLISHIIGEKIHSSTLIGLILIVVGLLIQQFWRKKNKIQS